MITLIDSSRSKIGYEFINYGGARECKNCNLAPVCVDNLEKGRKYKITGIRDIEHDCRIYKKMRVVEIEEGEIQASVEKKHAFIGSEITFVPIECESISCGNYKYCNPEGLFEGDRCKIHKIQHLECGKRKFLALVTLKRVKT
jgi:hypothetical protein